jgi:hypothetical protein
LRGQGRTNVLQSVRGNERLEEVINLKEVGTAHVVVSRLCRIKTLKWARGWPSGASVLVDRRRVRAFGCLLVVTARGEGFGPVAVLVSLGGGEGQESIGSGAC